MWALALIPVSILQSAQLPQEDQHPWVLQYFALIKLSSYFAVSYEHVLLRSSVPLPHVFEHIPDHSPHSLELSVHPEVTIFDKPYSIWYCKKCFQSTRFSLFWNKTMNQNSVVCKRAIWIQKWVCVVNQSFDCGLKIWLTLIGKFLGNVWDRFTGKLIQTKCHISYIVSDKKSNGWVSQ